MLKQSNQFTNAIKSDVREAKARVTINNVVYDEDVINNIEFSGSALSGEQFSIGSTHENTVKVEFSEVIETITALDKVIVEIGFKREEFDESLKKKTNIKMGQSRMGTRLNLWNSREDVEYSLMGEFYITEHVDINYNDKITTISCKDQMVFLEDDYESNLTYPTDIRNVIVEIANVTGVQIDTLNIEELEGIQVGKIEGYSHRQALGFLAQLLVGYVYFNRKGLLQIKRLSDAEYDISTEEYFSKGLSKNGIRYRVGGITCNVPHEENPQQLFAGSKLGPQIAIENPLMTQSMLQSIYNKLQDVDYYPFDLEWRGNPALEVGDLVTVYDVEGNELKVPNLNYGLTYNGGLIASSSADTKSRTEIVASGRKTLQQQINTTQTRIKETSDNLMDAFKDAQEKITGNQGGFIVQRMNEDNKPYEFLVMDTEDINSATNVIRLNQQGIGFSRNGYNGPFGVAITIDGQIVADYITAGTLNANNVRVINLDVDSISGFNSSFIQSLWNGISSGMSADSTGLKISTTQSWDLRLGNSGVAVIDRLGRETGAFRATLDENGNPEGAFVVVEPGYIGGLARRRTDGSGLLTGEVFINGSTGALTVRPFTTFHESITMQDEKLLSMGPQGEIVSRGANLNRSTYERHQFYTTRAGNRRVMSMQWDKVQMGRDLDMDGWTITNESDVRLKENIEPSNLNALREIERLEFIEFEWKKEMAVNKSKPDGKHFGIKAQYAPFLQTKAGNEESYLSIDMNKQVNLNSKAIQELHEENKQLNERIEELEAVVHA